MTTTKARIPTFATLAEEAAFWDRHDVTDFADALQPVEVTVAEPLSSAITVRLQPQDLKSLRQQARAQGIGPSSLVRMWIKRRLKAAQRPAARSG